MDKQRLYTELQDCYSQQAEHFHHTRKKNRPEQQYIQDVLRQFLVDHEHQKQQQINR